MTRLPASLVLLTALVLLAAGCGEESRLTVYSGRSESLVGPLLERFSSETGVPIDVRYGDSAELALLIGEEGEGTPADVFYSQSPGATGYLAEAELLGTLPDATLDAVDPAYHDPDGLWTGVTGRQRVLVYNTELVEETDLPSSVFDVVDEPYTGRVAVAPTNGSFQDFVSAMRQVQGDDATLAWLEGLAEGGAPTYANNDAIVEAVGRGEVEMGLVNHYYALRFLEEDPDLPIANHLFAESDLGSLIIPSTVSITAAADTRDEAERLVEFLQSAEAQRYFADETKEYPLSGLAEAAADVGARPGGAPEVDITALGGDLEGTLELIESSGLGG